MSERAAVEKCCAPGPDQASSAIVVGIPLIIPAEGLFDPAAIIVALGRVRSQARCTCGRQRWRLVKLPQPVGAQALIKIGPEILGPLVKDDLELVGSLAEPPGAGSCVPDYSAPGRQARGERASCPRRA